MIQTISNKIIWIQRQLWPTNISTPNNSFTSSSCFEYDKLCSDTSQAWDRQYSGQAQWPVMDTLEVAPNCCGTEITFRCRLLQAPPIAFTVHDPSSVKRSKTREATNRRSSILSPPIKIVNKVQTQSQPSLLTSTLEAVCLQLIWTSFYSVYNYLI